MEIGKTYRHKLTGQEMKLVKYRGDEVGTFEVELYEYKQWGKVKTHNIAICRISNLQELDA